MYPLSAEQEAALLAVLTGCFTDREWEVFKALKADLIERDKLRASHATANQMDKAE